MGRREEGEMRREYRITKGQRYDREGVVVMHGRNRSLVSTYTGQAKLDTGYPVEEEVLGAIRQVITTGQPETVVLGEDEAIEPMQPKPVCHLWTPDQGCPLHGEWCAAQGGEGWEHGHMNNTGA
jgi:hypothetical protein